MAQTTIDAEAELRELRDQLSRGATPNHDREAELVRLAWQQAYATKQERRLTMKDMKDERQLPEAPASLNVRFSYKGYPVQLTLRAWTGAEILEKLVVAISHLDANGHVTPPHNGASATRPAEPTPASLDTSTWLRFLEQSGAQITSVEPAPPDAPDYKICSIHQARMERREKDGAHWYSHKATAPDGAEFWCRGS